MARTTELRCGYAWAAGFFDGEGCIRVNRTRNRHGSGYDLLVIQISQKDRQVLDRFQEIFGVGKVYPRSNPVGFVYTVGKQDAIHEIFEKMWPYLSSIKKHDFNRAAKLAVGRVAA